VVDGATCSLPPPLPDDLGLWHLEDVERGAATEVHDLHPRVLVGLRKLEGDDGVEGLLVEPDGHVHVGRQGGHMVEPGGQRHGGMLRGVGALLGLSSVPTFGPAEDQKWAHSPG
jgi:hypothetical protein